MDQIERRFRSAGVRMPPENRRQAYLIRGAKPIANRVGTAPGQIIELKAKRIILLPGPPGELEPMLDRDVLPYLTKRYPGVRVRSFTLHVFGHPESEIDEKIRPVVERIWGDKDTRTSFGILAHRSIIDVKATTEGKKLAKVLNINSRIKKSLVRLLGREIFGEDSEGLENAVGKLLKRRRETLSLAESCTGGLIADKITDVPGSSDYFLEGVVTYSNQSKLRILGVRKETLRKFGAVSPECAEEMARGILRKSGSDWSIAVTGIAGPDGGTKSKPVGLVYFCIAGKDASSHLARKFYGSRREIREKAALTALDLLRRQLI
jgi:nicotinamide-nucleotide amidase